MLNLAAAANKLRLLSSIMLFGFILAIIYHGLLNYLQFSYPFNTFLFQPWDRFKDFSILHDIAKDLNPYAHNTNYFPLAYILYYPFTWLSNQNAAVIIFLEIIIGFLCWNANYYLQVLRGAFTKSEYTKNIAILCLLSYPTLFCLDRANLDGLVFVFVAFFMICFSKKYYLCAALLLAIAIGMKAYPVLFIILFLKQKQYKALVYCMGFTFLLSLLALSLFKAGIFGSLIQFSALSQKFTQQYMIYDGSLTGTISIFSLLKIGLKYWYLAKDSILTDSVYRMAIIRFLPCYFTLGIGIFTLMTLYILRLETVLWKQVMLIVIMLTLLPTISGDYRLLFFYTPLFLFLTHSQPDPLDNRYTWLFGLLFIPKNFFMLPHTVIVAFECFPNGPCGNIPVGGYSVMSLLNIIILVTFAGLIVSEGLKQRYALNHFGAIKGIAS